MSQGSWRSRAQTALGLAITTLALTGCHSGLAVGSGEGGGAVAASGAAGASSSHVAAPSPVESAMAGADPASSSGGPFVEGGPRWLGRFDASDPKAVKLAWSASGLVAVVRGPRISVRLRTEGATESVFFQPVIDGVPGPRFEVANGDQEVVVLAAALSPGQHVVELYRETEGGFGVSTFEGFAEGVVLGAPPPSGRMIEIVGDSISAGYGDLGVEVHPPWDNSCSFTLGTESAYQAYGPVMARALHADVSVVARSGWGVVRSGGGDPSRVLSAVYRNALGDDPAHPWDFRRPADVVVVNLGTNDVNQGDPGRAFEDAYVPFLRTIRGKNPKAWVFLTIGTMTSDPALAQMRAHIANVLKKLGDAKVDSIPLDAQDARHTGCDYHPDAAEQRRMADLIGAAVRAKLGW